MMVKAAKKTIVAITDVNDEELMTAFTGAEAGQLKIFDISQCKYIPLAPNHLLHGPEEHLLLK